MTSCLPFDPEKSRRETLRWVMLLAINAARPMGIGEILLLDVVRQVMECSIREIRLELGYLAERDLLRIEDEGLPQWHAKLTRKGIDVVEYTSPCGQGIARPVKYWCGQ